MYRISTIRLGSTHGLLRLSQNLSNLHIYEDDFSESKISRLTLPQKRACEIDIENL
jgi:hypothetical protein